MSQFIGNRIEFVKKYAPFIYEVTKGTGILAGTLAAQAILESSGKYNGQWYVGGSGLSRKANNFFGIKCSSGWKGKKFNAQTGEYTASGSPYTTTSCFRAYDSVEDSMKDYVNFLLKNPRYKNAGVFNAKTVKQQALALKKAGYATAPNYASTVNDVYLSIASYLEAEKKKRINVKKVFAFSLVGAALYLGISKLVK